MTPFGSDYLDVGGVKGSVVHMSIRQVRLRHHLGALHTVPFGGITHSPTSPATVRS
jgi:small-conductance mechanosensitive channel